MLEGDCKEKGVLDAMIWESGLVCLSKNLQLYAMFDLDRDPFVIKLKDPNIQEPPLCWTVIEPRLLASLLQWRGESSETMMITPISREQETTSSLDREHANVDVLLAVSSGTVLIVNRYQVNDMLVKFGPLTHIALSPTAKHIACVTKSGTVYVVTSDFTQNVTTFETQTSSLHQLAWCGPDAVACYWDQGTDHILLLIGPHAKWLKYEFAEPIHLVGEIDGLRILSPKKCEFLHRVPSTSCESSPPSPLLLLFTYHAPSSVFTILSLTHSLSLSLSLSLTLSLPPSPLSHSGG
jgi:hypothetical protein